MRHLFFLLFHLFKEKNTNAKLKLWRLGTEDNQCADFCRFLLPLIPKKREKKRSLSHDFSSFCMYKFFFHDYQGTCGSFSFSKKFSRKGQLFPIFKRDNFSLSGAKNFCMLLVKKNCLHHIAKSVRKYHKLTLIYQKSKKFFSKICTLSHSKMHFTSKILVTQDQCDAEQKLVWGKAPIW